MSLLLNRFVKTVMFCTANLFFLWNLGVLAEEIDTTELFTATEKITKHDNTIPRWVFDFRQSEKTKDGKWSKCRLPKGFDISTDSKFSNLLIRKYSISVSRQFFGCELKAMYNKILNANPQLKTIYIVDLRQEPHLFLDGIPVSYRTPRGRHTVGLNNTEQVKAKEGELSKSIKSGMAINRAGKSFSGECDRSLGICENDREYKLLKTAVVQREEEIISDSSILPKGIKVVYKRFPVTDHSPALFKQVEDYFNFLKTVDFENSHIHLHCKGGKGRTMTFLSMVEKYLSPNVKIDQILKQQYEAFGRLNLVYHAKNNWKNCLAFRRYNALKCLDKLKIIDVSPSKKDFTGMPEVKKCWEAQYNDDINWENC